MDQGHLVFDRLAVRRHRDRAAPIVARVRPILQEAAERLIDRLDDTAKRFTQALDIGGRGVVAPSLQARGIDVVSCDLSARMAALAGGSPVVADEESLPFGRDSFDLVVASLSLHWINDLPGALIQLRMALRPGGLLLASMPALGTLDNVRIALAEAEAELTGGASPRVSPFVDLRDGAGLLQRAGFDVPVADSDSLELAYADPLALLRDLRAAGETNAILRRNRRPPDAALFASAFARLSAGDGCVPVTIRIATLTGWAPA
jgi:SAM-dependent methyltransferase